MKILTYGRLGKEFAEYANGYEHIHCEFAENEELEDKIADFEIIAGLEPPVPVNISHVKWVHSFSAGVDYWLKRNDLSGNLLLTKTKGRMGLKMGEYCLAYLLYILKEIGPTISDQMEHEWQRHSQEYLFNKKVFILGTAAIGQGIAQVLLPLVESITGLNTSGKKQKYFHQVITSDQLNDQVDFDVVINALPLTGSTEGFCNIDFFKNFNSVIYFNVGRGATTNTDDLLYAIKKGHIKKAVLDVFKTEPLPADSKLWEDPSVIISPHQSAVTDIEDVKLSFPYALKAFTNEETNDYVVKIDRGY